MEQNLPKFLEAWLAKADPSKDVYFRKDVCDCEHSGDVRYERNSVYEFIKDYGGSITDEFWDGHDCGEAWIECKVPFQHVRKVLAEGFFDYDPWQKRK